MSVRQGEIFWIADCPPLHGEPAPHAVMIVSPPRQIADPASPLYGVVISSAVVKPTKHDVPLPNRQQQRNCNTGLTKPCWAVSGWILRITDRTRLKNRAGYASGKALAQTVAEYIHAIEHNRLPLPYPHAADDDE